MTLPPRTSTCHHSLPEESHFVWVTYSSGRRVGRRPPPDKRRRPGQVKGKTRRSWRGEFRSARAAPRELKEFNADRAHARQQFGAVSGGFEPGNTTLRQPNAAPVARSAFQSRRPERR